MAGCCPFNGQQISALVELSVRTIYEELQNSIPRLIFDLRATCSLGKETEMQFP
jgi:hypothetical protein